MKKLLFLLCVTTLITSCDPSESNKFAVSGSIDGVRVGKIFLQRFQDSVLIDVDSVEFNGKSSYSLTAKMEEPEIMYLHLDVKDGTKYNDRLAFFAEDTLMTINSSLDRFERDAVITGSKNQDVLTEFQKNLTKLNQTQTDLFKRSMVLEAQENPDVTVSDSINQAYDKYLRKKVLYAVNYAQLHKDKEVAPYILMNEATEANPVLLDSVFQKMPKKIQTTVYGKQLSELIQRSK